MTMPSTSGALAIGIVVALGGCTHSYTLAPRTYSQVNARAEHRTAEITFARGQPERAAALRVGPVSTSWLDPRTGHLHAVPTATLRSVVFRERGQGLIEGLALGVVGGLALGTAIGALVYRADDDTGQAQWGRARTIWLTGLAGASIGSLVGAGKGTTNVYRVPPAGAD